MAIDFPTDPAQVRPRRIGKVTDVQSKYNAAYGDDGRNGLYISVQFGSKSSDFFYPAPPSRRATVLLESLDAIGIAPINLPNKDWTDLIGYVLEWQSKTVASKYKDKDTGALVSKDLTIEIPTAIVARPGEDVATTEVAIDTDSDDFLALCEIVLESAQAGDKTPRTLLWAVEKDPRVTSGQKGIISNAVEHLMSKEALALVEGKYATV